MEIPKRNKESQRKKERPSNLNRFNYTVRSKEEIIVEQLNMRDGTSRLSKKKETNERK